MDGTCPMSAEYQTRQPMLDMNPVNTQVQIQPTADEGEAAAAQQVALGARQLGGQAGGQREVLRLL